MGRDKARLPFRGATLSQTIFDAVQTAAGEAFFVGNPELGGIPDRYPGEGPLGGILTALEHSRAEWNLIVACDLPELTADFLRSLLDEAARVSCDVLLPHAPGGRPEPLCAVYRQTARPALAGSFAAGTRKITDALAGLAVYPLEVKEVLPFQNVNTPEDWSRYAAG